MPLMKTTPSFKKTPVILLAYSKATLHLAGILVRSNKLKSIYWALILPVLLSIPLKNLARTISKTQDMLVLGTMEVALNQQDTLVLEMMETMEVALNQQDMLVLEMTKTMEAALNQQDMLVLEMMEMMEVALSQQDIPSLLMLSGSVAGEEIGQGEEEDKEEEEEATQV
jgi:hypothetical protein